MIDGWGFLWRWQSCHCLCFVCVASEVPAAQCPSARCFAQLGAGAEAKLLVLFCGGPGIEALWLPLCHGLIKS